LDMLNEFLKVLSVVCGIKEKGGKQERINNIEAKNLSNGRTLTTMMALGSRLQMHLSS